MQQSLSLSPHPLALGTMEFGGRATERDAEAMFEAAYEAGLRHFDTAHLYNEGASERLIGRFASRKSDCILATKIGYSGGASAQNLRKQFQLSQQRLGGGPIDLLYLHLYDAQTPLEESLETLVDLQDQGAIGEIGLSNFAAWQVMKAQAIAARLGSRIAAIQPMYSLLKRQAEVELLPMAADQAIEVFSYSPLGAGLLTGKYSQGRGQGRLAEDPRYGARYGQEAMHQTATAFARLAQDWDIPAPTLAVAWVMAHPSRPRPLIAARNLAQLAPSLNAASVQLSPAEYEAISALSPSPAPATDRLEEQASKALPSDPKTALDRVNRA